MKEYVLGFAFRYNSDDERLDRVVLIKKNKPEFMSGKWNGVGGKMEEVDAGNPRSAMIREFGEETGCQDLIVWRKAGTMQFLYEPGTLIHIFAAVLPPCAQVRTVEAEEVLEIPFHEMHMWTLLPNLAWLMPIALNSVSCPKAVPIHITEGL